MPFHLRKSSISSCSMFVGVVIFTDIHPSLRGTDAVTSNPSPFRPWPLRFIVGPDAFEDDHGYWRMAARGTNVKGKKAASLAELNWKWFFFGGALLAYIGKQGFLSLYIIWCYKFIHTHAHIWIHWWYTLVNIAMEKRTRIEDLFIVFAIEKWWYFSQLC